ncbi:MAG: ACT domain-containing protein [Gemmobacter sp.]
MTGEMDLKLLLAEMSPQLCGLDWGYATAPAVPAGVVPFATVAEDEGMTLIAPMADLAKAGLAAQGPFARITLTIHSALQAVGLTAAVSGALAAEGISANVVAGFHHDHIFLPANDATRAMDALQGLTDV